MICDETKAIHFLNLIITGFCRMVHVHIAQFNSKQFCRRESIVNSVAHQYTHEVLLSKQRERISAIKWHWNRRHLQSSNVALSFAWPEHTQYTSWRYILSFCQRPHPWLHRRNRESRRSQPSRLLTLMQVRHPDQRQKVATLTRLLVCMSTILSSRWMQLSQHDIYRCLGLLLTIQTSMLVHSRLQPYSPWLISTALKQIYSIVSTLLHQNLWQFQLEKKPAEMPL